MKFYNRQKELKIFEKHYQQVNKGVILDVLIGRRRIGKTELIKQFMRNKKALYFFVSRKPLIGLLGEWSEILRNEFPAIGNFDTLGDFLKAIFELSRQKKLLVVFDEFQNFRYINPAAFSQFQQYFDQYKNKSKMLLIVVGSVTTLMEKIFKDTKEPLFGRATRKLYLSPLDFKTILEILADLKFQSLKKHFDIYSFFNGVPKYYVLIKEERLGNQSLDKIIQNLIISPEAILKNEGIDLLKEEFGKDYARYFEILSLIARGKTKISEIGSFLKLPQTTINVYLNNLEKKYNLIQRCLPILERPQARLGRYYLKDTFLTFWFRFVYRYLSWIEQGATPLVNKIIKRDLSSYQGLIFERLVKDLIFQASLNNRFPFVIKEIGRFWDRKGEIEIDLVAYDLDREQVFIGECKLSQKRINQQMIKALKAKSQIEKFSRFKKKHLGIITLERLPASKKKWLHQQEIKHWELKDLL